MWFSSVVFEMTRLNKIYKAQKLFNHLMYIQRASKTEFWSVLLFMLIVVACVCVHVNGCVCLCVSCPAKTLKEPICVSNTELSSRISQTVCEGLYGRSHMQLKGCWMVMGCFPAPHVIFFIMVLLSIMRFLSREDSGHHISEKVQNKSELNVIL